MLSAVKFVMALKPVVLFLRFFDVHSLPQLKADQQKCALVNRDGPFE